MDTPIEGSYVALPTPFGAERVDLDAFSDLVDEHVAAGTDGIVVCGTTGESTTLSEYERRSLIHAAVDLARGRIPVMAGVGTNCTRSTVEMARFAVSSGVDSLLVVTPYYNKPSPKGLLLHYGAVAEAVDAPMVLYNVPSRTGIDLVPALAAEIAGRFRNVVAIKEATTKVERVPELAAAGLAVLCGEDSCLPEFVAAGATGAVSVVGNLLPAEVAELLRVAGPAGDPARAQVLWERIAPLARALFVETNPVPLKAALARLGRCSAEVRPPLAPLEPRSRELLETALRASGLVGAALTR